MKNKLKKLIKNISLLNNKKIEFKEYIQKKDIYKKDIFEVLSFILNKEINETEILEEVKNLNQENKINLIDYLIKVKYSKKNSEYIEHNKIKLKIIQILSKENYYRETIISNIDNIRKYKSNMYHDPNDIVRSLEVSKKEDFLIILDKIKSINFFLLNCTKFNYTEEEKQKFKKKFNEKYYLVSKPFNVEKLENVQEKTTLSNIFLKINSDNENEKENIDFFVKNIKNIKGYNLKCEIILEFLFPPFSFYYYNINNFNTKLYLEVFDSNRDLIPIFEEYLKEIMRNRNPFACKKGQDYNFVIGLAERLILEKELKDF